MFVSAAEEDLAPRLGQVAPSGPTGFFDVLTAGFTAEAIETDWQNYTGSRVRAAYGTIYSALTTTLGEDRVQEEMRNRGLRTERLQGNRSLSNVWGSDPRYGQALLDMAQGQIEDFFGPVPATREALAQSVYDDIRSEWDDASATLEMGGQGRAVAEFLGRGGAAMSDEVSLLTLPLGAGAGSFGRALLMESALGALSEAAILPRQYRQAERLGTPDPNPVEQIAMGAVFGGALGVAGEGVSRALTYTRLRRSLTRIPDGISQPEAQAAVEAAQQALEAGEPVPPVQTAPALPTPEEIDRFIEENGLFQTPPREEVDQPSPPLDPTADQVAEETARLRRENPELGRARPTLDFIREIGGIQWRRNNPNTGESELTPVAQALSAMGLTAQNLVGNIRRTGLADIDNIVASEFADGGTPRLRTDDTGTYLDRNDLLDAIAQEIGGTPAYRTIEAEDAAAQLRDLEDSFDTLRGEMSAVAEAEGVTRFEGVEGQDWLAPPRDGDDNLQRAEAAGYIVDDYIAAMDTTPSSDRQGRAARILADEGGTPEQALYRAMMDEIEEEWNVASEASGRGGAEALPEGEPPLGAGRAQSSPANDAGIDQGNAGVDGPRSESTPAGDQLVAPGVDPITERQRLEAAQAAPMRGGDAVADDGLFDMNARLQRDMFDDPESPKAQERMDQREEEMRAAMEGMEDVTLELEGQTVSARSLLDDMEADRAHINAIETCGWTGGGQ